MPPITALREISLNVSAGDALAVMGASGSGKSTLCHVLAGLAPRYTSGTFSGAVQIAGCNVQETAPDPGIIGVLFQDATTQLFNHTVAHEIAWGLEATGMPSGDIDAIVERALRRFDLHYVHHRPPWALSGGQQKRLALAAIWAMQPQVLLLDEPLGGLDPQGRVEVLHALDDLRESGATLLLTTLRPQSVALTSQALLIERGAVTAALPSTAVAPQAQCLTSTGITYPPEMWPDFGEPILNTAPYAIELQHLSFHYPDGPPVLQEINVQIPQGQFVAVVGPNGAGKSTLVRHINGLLSPTGGNVHILGKSACDRSVGALAQQVSFLFQRPEQQFFNTTVRKEIAFGPQHLHLENAHARVDQALSRFALTSYADLPPAILSYGIQRAITLASLAALDTPILVLDEPSVGLDGYGWAQLLDWLVERRAAGTTLIVVTHEMSLAAQADRVLVLEAGKVIADGIPPDTLSLLPARVST